MTCSPPYTMTIVEGRFPYIQHGETARLLSQLGLRPPVLGQNFQKPASHTKQNPSLNCSKGYCKEHVDWIGPFRWVST